MVATGAGASIVVFGGVSQHGWEMDLLDVWSLDPGTMSWDSVSTLHPGDAYSASYDEQSGRVVVFSLAGDTWAFDPDASEWERMAPAISPSGRCGQRSVYDQAADRVILFGGFACTAVDDPMQNDTWAYDYESDTWTALPLAASPPARMYHAMAYDPSDSRTVMWGGRVEDPVVWTFRYGAEGWERHEDAGGPSGIRSYHTMTFDPTLNAMVVFGGLQLDAPLSFDGVLQNDTWILDPGGDGWIQVEPGTRPTPRSHHAAVYDQALDRVVVYGGELEASYSGVMTGEVWLFDSRSRRWLRREPG